MKYQRIHLQDEQGTEIWASLFGVNIGIFKDKIAKGNDYEISNILVKDNNPQYARGSNKQHLYISDTTRIVHVTGEGSPTPVSPPIFNIEHLLRGKPDLPNLAIVVRVFPPKKVIVHESKPMDLCELYVADDSPKQLLLISIWHDLASVLFEDLQKPGALNNVIHLTDLQSRTYNEYSLATTMSTIFNLHPEGERASSLRKWFEGNAEAIKARPLPVRGLIPLVAPTNVTSIHDALSKKANQLASGQLLRIHTKVPEFRETDLKISTGCKHCGANPPDDYGLEYTCKTCGNLNFPEAKLLFLFKARDCSGTISLRAYTRNAEKLFNISASDLLKKNAEGRAFCIKLAMSRLRDHHTDMLITPVASLINHDGLVKWALKEVMD